MKSFLPQARDCAPSSFPVGSELGELAEDQGEDREEDQGPSVGCVWLRSPARLPRAVPSSVHQQLHPPSAKH